MRARICRAGRCGVFGRCSAALPPAQWQSQPEKPRFEGERHTVTEKMGDLVEAPVLACFFAGKETYVDVAPKERPLEQSKDKHENQFMTIFRQAVLAFEAPAYEATAPKHEDSLVKRFQLLCVKQSGVRLAPGELDCSHF